ncbi:MAG: amidohydrolase family protein [Planctomycetes bacterium]|nr:amidohydrolase family protein [Planctomycetota bacterium]
MIHYLFSTRATAVFCLIIIFAASARAQTTAIKAGKLLDPETGEVKLNQIILIEGDAIREIGTVAIPEKAAVIDLSNATVMPGLFDCHTHLCLTVKKQRDRGNYYYTTLQDPTPLRAIEGVANAKAMLEAGFTTVRDVGNAGNYADTALREAIERKIVPGPTMLNAGRIIAPFGGQFHLQPEKRELGNPEYFYADTRDEILKAIRENIHFGATVIKLVVDDQRYIYSIEDIQFAVAEAARAGLRVAAHAWTPQGCHNAAAAGVASIEHGFHISDDDLALAKKNNVTLVGTDFTAEIDPENHGVIVQRLRRAVRANVNMAFGTDVTEETEGYTRGSLAMSIVDSWIEAGVPSKTLMRAMTIHAARLCGVERTRGALDAGLAADIVATPENPIDDPLTLKHVFFVMKDGKIILHKAPEFAFPASRPSGKSSK